MRYFIGTVAIIATAGIVGLVMAGSAESAPVRLSEGQIAEVSFRCCWQDLKYAFDSCRLKLAGDACGGSGVNQEQCEAMTITCNEVISKDSWNGVEADEDNTTWWGIDGGGVCKYKPGGSCQWDTLLGQPQCLCRSQEEEEESPYAKYYSGCTP